MSEDIYDMSIITQHPRNHVWHKPCRSWMAYESSNCRALPWWPGHTARSGMFRSRRRSASRTQSKTPGDQRSQGPGTRWGRMTLEKDINYKPKRRILDSNSRERKEKAVREHWKSIERTKWDLREYFEDLSLKDQDWELLKDKWILLLLELLMEPKIFNDRFISPCHLVPGPVAVNPFWCWRAKMSS